MNSSIWLLFRNFRVFHINGKRSYWSISMCQAEAHLFWKQKILWFYSIPNHPPRRPRDGQLGQEKRRGKFSRTGRRGPGILLFTNQIYEFLSLIGYKKIFFMPNQRPGSKCISLLSWSSYTKEFTCSTFLEKSFQFFKENEPQSLIYQFHLILLQHWGEKFNKFINFKGREIFSCTCLTSMPSRHVKSKT